MDYSKYEYRILCRNCYGDYECQSGISDRIYDIETAIHIRGTLNLSTGNQEYEIFSRRKGSNYKWKLLWRIENLDPLEFQIQSLAPSDNCWRYIDNLNIFLKGPLERGDKVVENHFDVYEEAVKTLIEMERYEEEGHPFHLQSKDKFKFRLVARRKGTNDDWEDMLVDKNYFEKTGWIIYWRNKGYDSDGKRFPRQPLGTFEKFSDATEVLECLRFRNGKDKLYELEENV